MRAIGAVIAALGAVWSGAASASEAQVWTTLLAQGPVRGKLAVWVEVQGRLTDNASRVGTVVFRPAIGVQFAPGATALAGYAYLYTDPESVRPHSEHRPWQQLTLPVATLRGRMELVARARMEERFLEGEPDVSARFRTMLRIQPRTPARPGPLLWTEGFWNLNDANWGPRTGFEQLRLFGGVSVPVAPSTALEAGYMRQLLYRAGGDRIVNVASVTLRVRLGRSAKPATP